MPKNDCAEFENAVHADARISVELQRHAEQCERCRSLREVASLSALPVATERTDSFAPTVVAAAKEVAGKRGASLRRRRRTVPLLIGATGHLLTFWWLVSSISNRGLQGAVSASAAALSLPPLPAPDPASIAVVMCLSAAAMVLVALATRGRQVLSA
jgi:hypothetical protein